LLIGLTACDNKNKPVDNRNDPPGNSNHVPPPLPESVIPPPPQECLLQNGCIYYGSTLSRGLDMGIDASGHIRGWVSRGPDYLRISFPAHQDWAAVFITVGKPRKPPRPYRNFSSYRTLTVDMRGESGGEQVEIGIKSNKQPDDGSEAKETVTLTKEWQTYPFPLKRFEGADLSHLYVITEFVYNGDKPETVYLRRINYH
jgi:hypothetical protein